MSKKSLVIRWINICLLLIVGIECLIPAFLIKDSADVNDAAALKEINFSTPVYLENVEVVTKIAVKSVYEERVYDAAFETYSTEFSYFVYDASEPIEKGEIETVYYLAVFEDSDGPPQSAILRFKHNSDILSKLENCPAEISGCLTAYNHPSVQKMQENITKSEVEKDSKDLQRIEINEFNQHKTDSGIDFSEIEFEYETATIDEFVNKTEKSNNTSTIAFSILSVLMIGGGILLMIFTIKKSKKK